MMIPKTLSNVFARRILENPQHSIFFVGYANPESPAGLLRDAGTGGEVALDPDKPPQRIRCNIEQFQFSAHATRESLVAYARKISPKKILLVHGDPPAVEWMRADIIERASQIGSNCAPARRGAGVVDRQTWPISCHSERSEAKRKVKSKLQSQRTESRSMSLGFPSLEVKVRTAPQDPPSFRMKATASAGDSAPGIARDHLCRLTRIKWIAQLLEVEMNFYEHDHQRKIVPIAAFVAHLIIVAGQR